MGNTRSTTLAAALCPAERLMIAQLWVSRPNLVAQETTEPSAQTLARAAL